MNKNTQADKIKNSFISATKELISTNGLEKVSARNIAKTAGYSYATIYNYFNDLNELSSYCKADYSNDYSEYITNHLIIYASPLDTVIDLLDHYLDYTLMHPSKYLLLYNPTISISTTQSDIVASTNHDKLEIIFNRYLSEYFSQSGIIESMHADIYDIIMSYLYGKLTYYLKIHKGDHIEFKNDILNQLDILLTSFL